MTNEQIIVKGIQNLSGKYSSNQIFFDWVECSAIAIQNNCVLFHDDVWNKREQRYKEIMNKYTLDERLQFSEMFRLLVDEFEERVNQKNLDYTLGKIYMESNAGNKHIGQFFTPFNLSLACAKSVVNDFEDKITLNEPSCGAGGLVVAVAQVFLENGANYQRKMKVVCQDLDCNCVHMCYLQLSLLGIDAIIVQGDTLCDPYHPNYPKERTWRTPRNTGLLI